MQIAIIGGGPAGLYAAILLKKQRPQAEITVYERNRADDTFGFGVVFSDATLDNFEKYDPPSYRRITDEFAYWDDIAIHFKGTVHRVGGNGFCGCSRRTLLLILQNRARELGVHLLFETEVEDETRFADADLIVLADGSNSRLREKHQAHFQPEIDLRSNKFAWMGSTKPLDAFTFVFEETEWGPFIAHAYQYEVGHSTWIFETDPETFKRAGLEGLSEQASADRMAKIFGWFLDGYPLLINRSMWRNFPMIRSRRWVKDNMVLLGDAKATAHFSIGSGTKLAMEDAIALADALPRRADRDRRPAALRTEPPRGGRKDPARRRRVAGLVRACRPLLGFRSRAVRVRGDDRDPRRSPTTIWRCARRSSWREADRVFARQVAARGFDVDLEKPDAPMFQPFRLREMVVANRAVVSPMCMYSAKEGVPGDFHLVHYGSRAIGGAGLVFTEMTCVGARRPHHAGLCRAVERRAGSGVAAHRRFRPCQFGRENLPAARPCRPQGRHQTDVGRHGPAARGGRLGCGVGTPLPYFPDSQVPRELDRAAMDRIKAEFVAGRAARRTLRLRHARTALRPRLSAGEFHFAADQPAHRRIWRLARKPAALSARSVRGDARGVAVAQADVGAHFRDRLGRGRHLRRRCGQDRARVWRGRRRSRRRLDRPDRARIPADLWPHVPDAVLGTGAQRRPVSPPCASATSRRPIRSTPFWPPAAPISLRSAGRIWSIPAFTMRAAAWYGADDALSAAISAGQGTDLPQQRPRPPGFRGA